MTGNGEVLAQVCEVAAEAVMAAQVACTRQLRGLAARNEDWLPWDPQMTDGLSSEAAFLLEMAEWFREEDKAGPVPVYLMSGERRGLEERLEKVRRRVEGLQVLMRTREDGQVEMRLTASL